MTETRPNPLLEQELGEIAEQSRQIELPPETTVFRQGDRCENYLLVLQGSVKVFSRAENGREILLYRVRDGESCTLTTACLFGDNPYPAEGVSETEVSALAIPRPVFNRGLAGSENFRRMIFDQYARRLSEVITLVEALSFGRIDIRLARLLLQLGARSHTLETTHQSLAIELGSVREVISRQLKDFEHRGLVSLQRGRITLKDIGGLRRIAETSEAV